MTFKEKSTKKSNDKTTAFADVYTFNDIVDRACEGLADRQIKYSIRRIQEMEDILCEVEHELTEFLKNRNLRMRN